MLALVLVSVNLRTEFEVPAFTLSDMNKGPNSKQVVKEF